MGVIDVRESAQFIASKAEHVKIDNESVEKLAKHVSQNENQMKNLNLSKNLFLFPFQS